MRFLLLGGLEHRLDALWQQAPIAPAEVVAAFGDLVLANRAAVLEAMAFRSVQTNEPARCAHMAAGLGLIQERYGPIAMIDVGTSAGLNLMVDRCHIDFGTVSAGPTDAALRLRCRLLGAEPPLPAAGLSIGWRCGVDLDPVDLDDEPSRRWLQSCVWVDQHERSERLATAIDAARADPPHVVRGDAVDSLAGLVASAPPELHVVAVTTWVTYYLAKEQRRELEAVLAEAGRPLSWLSLELPGVVDGLDRPSDTPSPDVVPSVLALVTWHTDGSTTREFLGWAHHHGGWLDWRAVVAESSAEPAAPLPRPQPSDLRLS